MMPSPKTLRTASASVALLVAIGFFVSHQWQSHAAVTAAAASPVAVTLAKVEKKPFAVIWSGLGQLQPWQSVVVRSRIDGQIKALHFSEGLDVNEGDLLVELDARAITAAVNEAKAQRETFEAQLKQARLDYDRARRLAANGNTSAQSVDQMEAKVEQLVAQVAGAEAQYQAALVNLDYTRITAPVSGRLGLKRVDAGNIVRATDQTGIVTLNQLNPMALLIYLPQQDLPQVQKSIASGHPVTLAVRGEPNGADIATGTLSTLDNAISETTGTVAVKAMLDNKDFKLWPGQSVMVRINLDTIEDALQVPSGALQRGPEASFVYRVREGKAEMVPITVERRSEETAQISGNLQPGDMVVTDGQLRLRPGSAVREIETPKAQASDAAH